MNGFGADVLPWDSCGIRSYLPAILICILTMQIPHLVLERHITRKAPSLVGWGFRRGVSRKLPYDANTDEMLRFEGRDSRLPLGLHWGQVQVLTSYVMLDRLFLLSWSKSLSENWYMLLSNCYGNHIGNIRMKNLYKSGKMIWYSDSILPFTIYENT